MPTENANAREDGILSEHKPSDFVICLNKVM